MNVMGKLIVKKDGGKFGLVDSRDDTYIVDSIFEEITEDERTGFLFAYKGSQLYRIARRCYKQSASFFDENDQMKYHTKTGIVTDGPAIFSNGYGLIKINYLYGIVDDAYNIICLLDYSRGTSEPQESESILL